MDRQRFLATADPNQALAELLSSEFWRADNDLADGRTSQAMFALLDRVRRFALSGADIKVFAIDHGVDQPLERDAAMAANFMLFYAQSPAAFHLALAGNRHTTPTTTQFGESMAWYLKNEHAVRLLSLDWRTAGGATWSPLGAGNTLELGEPGKPGEFVAIGAPDRAEGTDGIYYVGPVSPSPPAARLRDTPRPH